MNAGVICALAGRRIDAGGQLEHRFPLARREAVREKISSLLQTERVQVLVCSAACGADLLALEQAGNLRLRRRIILPFDEIKFRETSVIDRPGEWGSTYDRIISEVREAEDLVVLKGASNEGEAYDAATAAILKEASRLATEGCRQALALAVWEGASWGEGDKTASFVEQARSLRFTVREISTI